MKRSEVAFGLLRIPVDGLAVLAALLLSYRLREANMDLIPRVQLLDTATTLPSFTLYVSEFVLPGIAVFIVIAAFLRMYALRSTRSAWSEMGGIAVVALLWLVAVMAWYFLILKELFYSRILLLHAVFFIALFSALGRASLTLLQRALLRCGVGIRAVVSVGVHPVSEHAKWTLQEDSHYRYLGHVSDVAALREVALKRRIDLVLQTDPSPRNQETVLLIDYCRSHHVGYGFLPPVFADVPRQLRVDHLGLLPVLRFQPTPLDGWGRVFKRAFDVLLSIVFLVLLSPLLLLFALGVFIDGGWPVLYVSRRVGERGRGRISMLKFRSMVCDADMRKEEVRILSHRNDGPLFKVHHDPRVTRFGRFLRRWSLDELPQFL
ncbi:MAG: sugar transferase, partial [Candidatus Peribacteraceae bacterium]|nr:sugar transferase [Candidatus Peribacteraceae bacterium]